MAAGLVVAVGVGGFVGPVRDAVDHTRLVRSSGVLGTADVAMHHLLCLEEALRSVPDRPTYVEPIDAGREAEWYQRALELGFAEVPLVGDRDQAQQLLRIEVDLDGGGVCGLLDIEVERA